MTASSRTELIARLDGMIHDALKPHVDADAPLAMLDFPDYRNCGDSAIWLGQMSALQRHFGKRPAYVSRMHDFSAEDLERRVPEGPIFLTGGGNFGDIWVAHQDFREMLLKRFPNRKIVQLPQSIHYASAERVEQSKRAIGAHPDFTIMVRDAESKAFVEDNFDCAVQLCPDMAFAIGQLPARPSEIPLLAMMREDPEKAGADQEWPYPDIPKEDWIKERYSKVRLAKLIGAASSLFTPQERALRILDAAAHQRFERGISHISRGAVLVTDRLHVHICSVLLDRPHAVLDNSYGKIRRFMNAFYDGADLAYRADSLEDAVAWARAQAESRA